jgi:hypothetical protein
VRHPWLLGDALFILGIGVLLNRTGLIVVVAGMAFLDIRLMNREEADLERKLGGGFYRELCKFVPRVVPALRPRIAAGIGRTTMGCSCSERGGALGLLCDADCLRNNPPGRESPGFLLEHRF